ncbi:9491_t:CDS:1, partial [Dentiscutata heterogama]
KASHESQSLLVKLAKDKDSTKTNLPVKDDKSPSIYKGEASGKRQYLGGCAIVQI